jgi:aminoglycoside N3'-acetyltransferase
MKKYSKKDIIKALKKLGLKKGDKVYVSSNLGVVGLPEENIKNADELSKLFFEAILEVIDINEGTLLVPCFSYTAGKNFASEPAIFDLKKTKPEIGAFPTFIYKQSDTERSIDPMLSVCCIGRSCEDFMFYDKQCTYCEGGFLSKLAKSDIKILNIGIGPDWMPFIHYIDWLVKAPYRYDKVFNTLIKNDFLLNYPWLYSVRILSEISFPYEKRVAEKALKEGIWKKAPLGNIDIFLAVASDYFKLVYNMARENNWVLARGPVCDVFEEEEKRVKKETHSIYFSDDSELDILKKLLSMPRYKMSKSYDVSLNYIVDYFGVNNYNLIESATGEHIYGFIVPEKWVLEDFYLKDSKGNIIFSKSDDKFNRIFEHSLPYKNKISKEILLKHVKISAEGLKHFSCEHNRDWGFVIHHSELDKMNDDYYEVDIKTTFIKSKLTGVEFSLFRDSCYPSIALVGFLDGPYKADENLSTIFVLKSIFDDMKKENLKFNLNFAILPSKAGLNMYIKKRQDKIKDFIILNFLGNSEPFTFLTNNRNRFKIPSYLFSLEYFLGYGNNPILEKFENPDVNILNIIRSEQPYSHKFPHPKANTDVDTLLDFNSVNESISFIKKLLLEVNL